MTVDDWFDNLAVQIWCWLLTLVLLGDSGQLYFSFDVLLWRPTWPADQLAHLASARQPSSLLCGGSLYKWRISKILTPRYFADLIVRPMLFHTEPSSLRCCTPTTLTIWRQQRRQFEWRHITYGVLQPTFLCVSLYLRCITAVSHLHKFCFIYTVELVSVRCVTALYRCIADPSSVYRHSWYQVFCVYSRSMLPLRLWYPLTVGIHYHCNTNCNHRSITV